MGHILLRKSLSFMWNVACHVASISITSKTRYTSLLQRSLLGQCALLYSRNYTGMVKKTLKIIHLVTMATRPQKRQSFKHLIGVLDRQDCPSKSSYIMQMLEHFLVTPGQKNPEEFFMRFLQCIFH